ARRHEPDPFRHLPRIFLVVATLCLGARFVHGMLCQPYSYYTHLFPTHFRLDSLLFGVLLCYWYRFHPDIFNRVVARSRFLLPILLLLVIPAFVLEQGNFFSYTLGLSLFYLGYGGLMIALLKAPITIQLFRGSLRPFAYIGQHSYPIYVFHL